MSIKTISIDSFGGPSNARFYNATNGKWYQDSGFSTEATDDAYKFQAASNYAASLGGLVKILIPAGNYYFSVKRGTNNAFVTPSSNTTWTGEGQESTVINISPGWNTALNGGYATVFGLVDYAVSPTAINNVTFENFCVNHNGAFNQFYIPNHTIAPTFFENNAIHISAGRNIIIRDITVKGANGTFCLGVGEYGRESFATEFVIERCSIIDFIYDVNNTDASYIHCGGYRGIIRDNRVIGIAQAGTTPFTPWTAYELHGRQLQITNNYAYGCNGGLNLPADSNHLEDIDCSGLTLINCTAGINLFQYNGWDVRRVNIHNNTIIGGWYGLKVIHDNATSGGATNGIYNLRFCDNLCTSTPGNVNNYAVEIRTSGEVVEVSGNQIYGYYGGIRCDAQRAAGVLDGITITNNTVTNTANVGILVGGTDTASTTTNIKNLLIDGNTTVDNRNTPVMGWGVYVNGVTDTTCRLGSHISQGHVNVDVFWSSLRGFFRVPRGAIIGDVKINTNYIVANIATPNEGGVAIQPGNGFNNLFGDNNLYDAVGNNIFEASFTRQVTSTNTTAATIVTFGASPNTMSLVECVVVGRRTGGSRATGAVGDFVCYYYNVLYKMGAAGSTPDIVQSWIDWKWADDDLMNNTLIASGSSTSGISINVTTAVPDVNMLWRLAAKVRGY